MSILIILKRMNIYWIIFFIVCIINSSSVSADISNDSKGIEKEILKKKAALEINQNSSIIHGELGRLYFALPDYTKALVHFKKALEQDSNDSLLMRLSGWCAFHLKDFEKAHEYFKKTIALNPNDHEAYQGLLNIYRETNTLEEGLDELEGFYTANGNEYIQYIRALCHNEMGNYDAAYEMLGKVEAQVLNVIPRTDQAQLYKTLGKIALRRSHKDQAMRYFEKAIALNKDEETYTQLAKLYPEEASFSRSISFLKSAHDDFPENAFFCTEIGKLYFNVRNFPEALKWLESAHERGARGQKLYEYLGQAYYFEGDYGSALEYLTMLPSQTSITYILRIVEESQNYERGIDIIESLPITEETRIHRLYALGFLNELNASYEKALEKYSSLFTMETNSPVFRVSFERAAQIAHEKLGDDNEAISIYKKAIEQFPREEQFYISLAELYFSLGQLDTGIAFVTEALKIFPDVGELYDAMGNMYTEKGEFQEAEQYYHLGLEKEKCDKLYRGLGGLFLKQRKYDKAEQYFLKGIERYPESALLYAGLGDLYMQQEKYQEAEEILTKALHFAPDDYELMDKMARMYLHTNNTEKAIEWFKKSTDQAPFFYACPYQGLGLLYAQLGDSQQAESKYREVIERAPQQAKGYYDLAYYLSKIGELDEALEILATGESFIDNDKRSFEFKRLRGIIIIMKKKYDEAYDVFKDLKEEHKALEKQYGKEDVFVKQYAETPYMGFGHVFNARKQYRKAARMFEEAYNQSENVSIMTMLGRAWVYANMDEHQEAIRYYQEIIDKEPYNVLALLGLANSHTWLKEYDKAEASLKKVLSINPLNAFASAQLGTLYLNRGEHEEAQRLFMQSLRQGDIGYSCPYEGLGLLYLKKGKIKEAETNFEKAIEINPTIEHKKYIGLARIEMQRHNFKRAKDLLKSALENSPSNKEALKLLGQIKEIQK